MTKVLPDFQSISEKRKGLSKQKKITQSLDSCIFLFSLFLLFGFFFFQCNSFREETGRCSTVQLISVSAVKRRVGASFIFSN